MRRKAAAAAILVSLLVTACGDANAPTAAGQGSEASEETIAIRSQIADIWRDATSTRRQRACLGYVAGEFLTTGGGVDPQVIGDQLAEGSLAGFDQTVVAQEWKTLLDNVCSDTREDFAAAEEALSPGGEGCQMNFFVQPDQVLDEFIAAASCEVVRGRTGGREVLVSLCIPDQQTRNRSFDIGKAHSQTPYANTAPRSERGSRAGCPRSTLWKFVIPLTVNEPLVVLTGKNFRKEYVRFALGFTN